MPFNARHPRRNFMEVLDFFEPVNEDLLHTEGDFEEASWFYAIDRFSGETPNLEDKKIALIGISDPEQKDNPSYAIRRSLYKLKRAEYAEEVIDLGNFHFNYQKKAYESLGFVLSELMANGLYPVIMNGRQDITYAQYLSFSYLKHYVNLAVFDSKLDFNLREEEEIGPGNYLQGILMKEPSYLFSLTGIGYQSHFSDTVIVDFLEKLYFDLYRLGDAQSNINEIEPALRSAHFASWDLSAVRQSDAPATLAPSPNGFYAEEACLLSRYSGLSSNMRSIGFYNYDHSKDATGQTAQLTAQMIWYFVDGFLNRYPESPMESQDDFLKFITNIQNNAYQIVFYKSRRTDRWWMEVPISEKEFAGGKHIMPCSYNDYLTATREEIPDRWLQAVKKLS